MCHNDQKKTIDLSLIDNDWTDKISSLYCGKNTWFNLCHNGLSTCSGENLISGAGHAMYADLRHVAYDGSQSVQDIVSEHSMTMRELDGDSNFTETMQIGPYNP